MLKSKIFMVLLIVVTLLILLVPACGKEKENTPVPTATPVVTATPMGTAILTPTPMVTPTATPTSSPVPGGPVKIGAITSWSGPLALAGVSLADPIIKLVEKQVKDQGGILGGREVKVVRYDNRGTVAEAVAGADKLFREDEVSALVFGGVSSTEAAGVAGFAEKNQILFVAYGTLEKPAENKFTISATMGARPHFTNAIVDLAIKVLKPKTVAIMGFDLWENHDRFQAYREGFEAAGIKVVSEQYTPFDLSDYSPYLTRVKYANPDMLVLDYPPSEPYLSIGKQMMELGGWGDMKVVGLPGAETAKRLPGVDGMYFISLWFPGDTYPGSVKFETEYKAMNKGATPSSTQVYYYNCLWTVIYAIELAGTTDRVAIGQAARSGNLEWDSPMGHAHYTLEQEGYPGLTPKILRLEGGKSVLVTIPE